ncbi:hypothetical protein MWU52_09825 [Jannaschia sp. S6380]|uniref:hypothetical protein n=1 Tax=Jannaschia sp. S6380 TaxID=2926408 RepID=UPI001FF3511D|nr:hypothetical protein [Jannaschia sp. S6380]MCK0167845.1 hypothetical protein [Jannaschia sp. S6380]
MRLRTPRLAALAVCLFPLLWAGGAIASVPPARPGWPVLVVSGPFGPDAATLLRRAGGHEVGPRRFPIGVVGHSQDADFFDRLVHGGAILLLDAGRMTAMFCGADV